MERIMRVISRIVSCSWEFIQCYWSSNSQLILGLSVCSMSSGISESSGSGSGSATSQLQNRDFKILLDVKSGAPQATIHLVAPTMQVNISHYVSREVYIISCIKTDNFIIITVIFKYTLQFFKIVFLHSNCKKIKCYRIKRFAKCSRAFLISYKCHNMILTWSNFS